MKIFKIIVMSLVIICVVVLIGVFVFLKTVDLNRFKGQITEQASKALGRDVAMKHVTFNFSFTEGIKLHLSGLSIADDPVFSTDPLLYIDSSHLGVDFLAFLLKRQVLVSNMEFDSLRIHVVRNSDGTLNVQSLGQTAGSDATGSQATGSVPAKGSPSSGGLEGQKNLDFGEMLIRTVRISDGTFLFTDRMVTPPMALSVDQFKLDVSNVSLNAPFPFSVEASVWSNYRNIRLNGLARIDLVSQQARVDDLKIETDLSDIDLERLYKEVPVLKEAGIQERMAGKFLLDVHQMVVGPTGLLVLSSDGQLKDVKVKVKDSPVPVEKLNMRFKVSESDAELEEITMPLAAGAIKITGRVMDYLTKQKFLVDLDMSDVQLSELTSKMALPAKLEGQIYVKSAIGGQGMDPEAIKSTLSGDSSASLKNGKVLDVNILNLVLSKISFLPNLAEQIEAKLPERYKEKLKAKDTILENVEMKAKIDQGAVLINEAQVNADGFLVVANGKIDLDQNLALSADLFIPADLSESLIAVANELSYFLDDEKRIHIPFKPYKGKLAEFRMYPDVEDIGKEILRKKGEEELKKVLYKAIDFGDQTATEQTSGSEEQSQAGQPIEGQAEGATPEPAQADPEEELINSIIDMIPIFK